MRDYKLQCTILATALVLAVTTSAGGPHAQVVAQAPKAEAPSKRPQSPASGKLYDLLKIFVEILSYMEANHVEEINPEAGIYGAIHAMMKIADPEGSFIPPDLYREMQAETQGRFGGLGLELAIREDIPTVVAPIEGGPAFRAGIQAGDQLVKVDGEATQKLMLTEVVRKLRGPEGTPVTISILRKGVPTPQDFTLHRQFIMLQSVRWQRLSDAIGYIKLRSFGQTTSEDLEEALEDLEKQHIRALVLDLRDNPGGLLAQAIAVADKFLAGGQLIVSTKGRLANQNMKGISTTKAAYRAYPMIVLVNQGSAAASEIVAGALQDLQRARLLGTRTFGRGLIQTIIPLSDGSGLRLTTARFFTPKGHAIHGTGITPDIVVEPSPSHGGARSQLPQNAPAGPPAPSGAESLAPLNPDVQLQRAVALLKAKQLPASRRVPSR
jgi:carboxyl-terminal processing protease